MSVSWIRRRNKKWVWTSERSGILWLSEPSSRSYHISHGSACAIKYSAVPDQLSHGIDCAIKCAIPDRIPFSSRALPDFETCHGCHSSNISSLNKSYERPLRYACYRQCKAHNHYERPRNNIPGLPYISRFHSPIHTPTAYPMQFSHQFSNHLSIRWVLRINSRHFGCLQFILHFFCWILRFCLLVLLWSATYSNPPKFNARPKSSVWGL